MIITICGSMSAARKMLEIGKELVSMGHEVHMPEGVREYANHSEKAFGAEDSALKIEHDLIRGHARLIEKSDAILVVNVDKQGIKNYIGGNSFLEMGFAHVYNKKVFLLNDVPTQQYIIDEVLAVQPTVLHGDLSKVG